MNSYGTRQELDGLPFIDTVVLKRIGHLDYQKEGVLVWTHPYEGIIGRISVEVDIVHETIHLKYKITNEVSDEVRHMDYYISLTSTACNFGGKRWWFLCPMVVGGRPCHGRVRRLYKSSDYFACRNCHNLCYSDQNQNHQDSFAGLNQFNSLERRMIKLQNEIKIPYYKGQPTRKMRQFLKLGHILETNSSVEDYLTHLSDNEV